jgi:hypothetical protein
VQQLARDAYHNLRTYIRIDTPVKGETMHYCI